MIYHITYKSWLPEILGRGIPSGWTKSHKHDLKQFITWIRMNVDYVDTDEYIEAEDHYDFLIERHVAELILDGMKTKDQPRNSKAVFFWSNKEPIGDRDYVVRLSIDESKIPCRIWSGPMENVMRDMLWKIKSAGGQSLYKLLVGENSTDDLNDVHAARALPGIIGMAEDYMSKFRLWDGNVDEDIELLAGCNIPVKAIVGYEFNAGSDKTKTYTVTTLE